MSGRNILNLSDEDEPNQSPLSVSTNGRSARSVDIDMTSISLRRSSTAARRSAKKDIQKSVADYGKAHLENLKFRQTKTQFIDEGFAKTFGEAQAKIRMHSQVAAGGDVSYMDFLNFKIENHIDAHPRSKYYLLLICVGFIVFIFAFMWHQLDYDDETPATERILKSRGGTVGATINNLSDHDSLNEIRKPSFVQSCYLVLQLVFTGGLDTYIDASKDPGHAVLFVFIMMSGLLFFTVLIGMVNDSVLQKVAHISDGKSKVCWSGHTVIVGWNEATVRVVVQLCFLRETLAVQNRTLIRRVFPWLRVKPSSPVVNSPIVLLCDTMSKREMEAVLEKTLEERGVSRKSTTLRSNVICRSGKPSDPHVLLRVGAHRACAVLVMSTDGDATARAATNGVVQCGYTLSILLAIRQLNISLRPAKLWDGFRCVVQSDVPSESLKCASFTNPKGEPVVSAVDLNRIANALIFTCTAYPGLANVLLDAIDFESYAFRAKDAPALGLVGKTLAETTLMYKNAVVCGAVDKRVFVDPSEPNFMQGLCVDVERRFTEHDRVIFLSETSTPTLSDFCKDTERLETLPSTRVSSDAILVCGFRNVWLNPGRLYARMDNLSKNMKSGAYIQFLNRMPTKDFAELVAEGGGPPEEAPGRWVVHGVHIVHTEGEAASLRDLQSVLQKTRFDAAIILGTIPFHDLKPEHRDLRVLEIMCLLRTLHAEFYPEEPLHVVGDTSIDSTAFLAIAPTGAQTMLPDFINTQAIYARVLAQTLAYPKMAPCLQQLFHPTPGNPQLTLCPVGLDLIPCGKATFAQLVQTVQSALPGDIVLGWVTVDGTNLFCPDPELEHDFIEGDKIVLLTRRELASSDPNPQMHPEERDATVSPTQKSSIAPPFESVRVSDVAIDLDTPDLTPSQLFPQRPVAKEVTRLRSRVVEPRDTADACLCGDLTVMSPKRSGDVANAIDVDVRVAAPSA
jgi:hypothetical protein